MSASPFTKVFEGVSFNLNAGANTFEINAVAAGEKWRFKADNTGIAAMTSNAILTSEQLFAWLKAALEAPARSNAPLNPLTIAKEVIFALLSARSPAGSVLLLEVASMHGSLKLVMTGTSIPHPMGVAVIVPPLSDKSDPLVALQAEVTHLQTSTEVWINRPMDDGVRTMTFEKLLGDLTARIGTLTDQAIQRRDDVQAKNLITQIVSQIELIYEPLKREFGPSSKEIADVNDKLDGVKEVIGMKVSSPQTPKRHHSQSVEGRNGIGGRRSSVIRIYKVFRNDLDKTATSPRTPIESLNLEISPSSSPKLNLSGEIALRESIRDTVIRESPLSDSASLKRRGTVAVLKPGAPRTSSGARDDASSPSLRRTNSKIADTLVPKHMYLDVRSAQFTPPAGTENLEVLLSLTSANFEQPIYENFRVLLGNDGRSLLGPKGTKTVFRDLPLPMNQLFLVCRLFRRGTLLDSKDKKKLYLSSNDKSDLAVVRQAVGFGVVDLAQYLQLKTVGAEVNLQIVLWTTTTDSNFWNGPQLVRMKSPEAQPLLNSHGVHVTLVSLPQSPENANILRPLPSLNEVPSTNGYQVASSIADGAGFRNDLYLSFREGSFTSKKPRTLKLSAKVYNNGGYQPILQRASSYLMSGEETLTTYVVQHSLNPKWDDSFCIKIPRDLMRPGHSKGPLQLHLTVFDVTKKRKEIGKGLINLVDSGICIGNGFHTVQITSTKDPKGKKDDKPGSGTVKIRLQLVSNEVTQNIFLSKLSQWRSMRVEEVLECLNQVTYACGEIPNVLAETLDSMFSILDSINSNEVGSRVFLTLSSVIDQLFHGNRAKESSSAFDRYISTQFKGLQSPGRLLFAMSNYLKAPKGKKSAELLTVLRSVDRVFSFISRSKQLDSEVPLTSPTLPSNEEMLRNLSFGVQSLMAAKEPEHYGAQMVAVSKLDTVFDFSLSVLMPQEAAAHSFNMLEAINTSVNRNLYAEKLKLISRMLKGELMRNADARTYLWPHMLKAAISGLANMDEELQHLSLSMIHQMVELIQKNSTPANNPQLQALYQVISPVLDMIKANFRPDNVTAVSPLMCDAAIAILAVLYITPSRELQKMVVSMPYDNMITFCSLLIDCLFTMIRTPTSAAFPFDWTEMINFQYRTTYDIILIVGSLLTSSKTNAVDGSSPVILDLLKNFMRLCLNVATSPHLRVEALTAQKREALLKKSGDMRESILGIASALWTRMPAAVKIQLTDSDYFDSLLLSTVIPNQTVADTSCVIVSSLITTTYESTHDLGPIRTRLVSSLCRIFPFLSRVSGGQQQYYSWWIQRLLPTTDKAVQAIPAESRQLFLNEISNVVAMLNTIESISDVDSDEKARRSVDLIDYLHSIGEKCEYLRQIQLLAEFHARCKNLIQAGQTLLLHANALQWDDTVIMEPLLNLPRQTMSARREFVAKSALSYFQAADQWEDAVAMTKLLAELYEARFNYNELTKILKLQAQLWSNALDPMRDWPTYWLIIYGQSGFPEHLAGKEFVIPSYRRINFSDLSERLRLQFPGVKVINSFTNPPPTDSSPQRIIQALGISPAPEAVGEFQTPSKIQPVTPLPSCVINARMHQGCSHFKCLVKDQEWLIVTQGSFPSILLRLDVTERVMTASRSRPPSRSVSPNPQRSSPRSGSPQRGGTPTPLSGVTTLRAPVPMRAASPILGGSSTPPINGSAGSRTGSPQPQKPAPPTTLRQPLTINTSGPALVPRPSSPGLIPPLPIGASVVQPAPQRPQPNFALNNQQLSEMDAILDIVDRIPVNK